jgi:uracil-DNA glycosylase family protein
VREIQIAPTLESWRDAARRLLAQGVSPADIIWREAGASAASSPEPGLFDAPPSRASDPRVPSYSAKERSAAQHESPESRGPATELTVPRAFLELARTVAAHNDPARWGLLYSVLFRIASGNRDVLLRRGDPELDSLRRLAADVEEGRIVAPAGGAAAFLPQTRDLSELARAAASCRGCDLYRLATQTVFGKGPVSARAVLVGEQPGDSEDLQGAPFVGPAGEVLDRALVEARLPRDEVYVTNVVKHFKFFERGKRRIHQTPVASEISACRPWLEAELAAIRPQVLVCLGATAAKALIGPDFRITRDRGKFLGSAWAPKLLATYHPSAVLRAENEAGQQSIYGDLVGDLKLVAEEIRP